MYEMEGPHRSPASFAASRLLGRRDLRQETLPPTSGDHFRSARLPGSLGENLRPKPPIRWPPVAGDVRDF